jgi:hypothetical protein
MARPSAQKLKPSYSEEKKFKIEGTQMMVTIFKFLDSNLSTDYHDDMKNIFHMYQNKY